MLRVQIRNELAFQLRDHIFQQQFTFLEATHLQFVAAGRAGHARYRRVEIAMLDTQVDQTS